MAREMPMCLESVRTLQGVLPSPGRVFDVVSRTLCSSSGIKTLAQRFRLGALAKRLGPFAYVQEASG
jgi:hypothetical protein